MRTTMTPMTVPMNRRNAGLTPVLRKRPIAPPIGAVTTDRMVQPDSGGNGAARRELTIKPPNFQTAAFTLRGTAAYVQNKFSQKALEKMKDQQQGGQNAKNKGKKRDPKDFDKLYEACQHRTKDGAAGIPAPAFRSAMIDACRVAGMAMTMAKMSVFVIADGVDCEDGTPLVRITNGKPHKIESLVRNDSGVVDIRPRAMWDEGWEAVVRVRYDGDQFQAEDVANLLMRAGEQVGVGEGRPFSKDSHGQGWGTFTITKR